MRNLDWPPVWLAGALGLVWITSKLGLPDMLGQPGRIAGQVLVALGLGLMAVAAAQMMAARTTVIPRRKPGALVTGGVFAVSRNPIYLADALVLAGAALWLAVVPMLILVAIFASIITRRFITGEEAALEAAFGQDYRAWAARTPRWIGWNR